MDGKGLELRFRRSRDGGLVCEELAQMEATALRDPEYRAEFVKLLTALRHIAAGAQQRLDRPAFSSADLDARDRRLKPAKGRTATDRIGVSRKPRLVWQRDKDDEPTASAELGKDRA